MKKWHTKFQLIVNGPKRFFLSESFWTKNFFISSRFVCVWKIFNKTPTYDFSLTIPFLDKTCHRLKQTMNLLEKKVFTHVCDVKYVCLLFYTSGWYKGEWKWENSFWHSKVFLQMNSFISNVPIGTTSFSTKWMRLETRTWLKKTSFSIHKVQN